MIIINAYLLGYALILSIKIINFRLEARCKRLETRIDRGKYCCGNVF